MWLEEVFHEWNNRRLELKKIFDATLEENPDMMNLGILLIFVAGVRIGEVVSLKHEGVILIFCVQKNTTIGIEKLLIGRVKS